MYTKKVAHLVKTSCVGFICLRMENYKTSYEFLKE
jgi:hypothetical protein